MGEQTRTRTVVKQPDQSGDECPSLFETQPCLARECSSLDPDRDCSLGNWSNWGTCTKSCGTGTRIRTREVLEPSLAAGSCDETLESGDCGTEPCGGGGGGGGVDPACESAKVISGQTSGTISIGERSSAAGAGVDPPVPPSSACEWIVIGSRHQNIRLTWDWVEMPLVFD